VTTTQPLVSIVTPVYNGALYIRECIESVLAQTYSNWDYTIVNNCSTDETLKIIEEYVNKDNRVHVYNNDKLLDIIANHNRAFRLISPTSKYCKDVSADDWLFPECLARMVSVAEANPSVGIVGSYQLSGGGTNWRDWRIKWAELPYPSTVIPGRAICRVQLLRGPYVFGTPTSLLYRSDLIKTQENFYPNSTPHADVSACYKYLQHTDFGFVHQVLSYERIHADAISTQCRSLSTHDPSFLCDLVEYGPSYLTPGELANSLQETLDIYYEHLAASVFHSQNSEFWKYHMGKLKESGHPFSYLTFGKAVITKMLDLIGNPKQTVEKMLGRDSGRSQITSVSGRGSIKENANVEGKNQCQSTARGVTSSVVAERRS